MSSKFTKKQKIFTICGILAIILIILICFITYNCGSQKTKENAYSLAKMYAERGEYDRALSVLDNILMKNSDDLTASELLNQIIEMKKEAEENKKSGNSNHSTNVNINTDSLTDAVQDSLSTVKDALSQTNKQAEENRKAMENLVRIQEEKNATEKARLEEEKRLAEEKRQLEEEKRLKAEAAAAQKKALEEKRRIQEEELAKKNAKLKKEMDFVNNEIQLGKTALSTGNVEEALSHFKKASENFPNVEGDKNYEASKKSEIAQALYDASEKSESESEKNRLMEEAVSIAKEVIAQNPKDSPAHYILAQDAINKKNYDLALKELKEAVQNASSDDPNRYLYYYDMGKLQYITKKYTEAVASFTTSCELNETFVPSRYNLGLSQVKLKNDSAAIAAFRKCIDVNPRYEKAYLEEARALSRRKDFSGAISAYESVIAINNINTKAISELGSVYMQAGRLAKSEESYRKALTMLSDGEEQTTTKYNLSAVLYEEGKLIDAEKYAKEAYEGKSFIKNNKSKANIVYNYAMILDKNEKQDLAIPLYQEVLDLNPSHNKTKINLGVMYMNLEPPEVDLALSLFNQVYQNDKNNFEVNNNLGSAYLSKEDYKNAILYFQNALRLESNNNAVRKNLANAYAKNEDYDNAKTTYTELIKLDSENWEAYLELAKVCMQLNDNTSAEKYLIYLQTKNPSFKASEVSNLLLNLQ